MITAWGTAITGRDIFIAKPLQLAKKVKNHSLILFIEIKITIFN
jgi:hypothetical protein